MLRAVLGTISAGGMRTLKGLWPNLAMSLVTLCFLLFACGSSAHAQQSPSLSALEESALRAAAQNVAASVVQIRTIGGLDTVAGSLLPDGPTTGLIISADGYIISSAFNFVQQPASILVTLPSGKQAPAELVATDHSRMLVLLKVTGVTDLPVAPMVPVDEIRPGQWAIAIGRTFYAEQINVSVGIVSAVGRMFGKVIQTDAAVSTANYGGPLVDIRGRVLGVIVPLAPHGASEVAGVEWYDSGIGFAVPLAALTERLERMKQGEDQRPAILGIGLVQQDPHSSPAELAAVRPDAPAGQAGLKQGDRIVEIDGRPIHTQTDLRFALGPRYGGETIRLVALRGEERLERNILLAGELPPFRHAFLGILPIRPAELSSEQAEASDPSQREGEDTTKSGIIVRFVYENSPAANAGVQANDRIVAINDTEINSIDAAIEAMNNVAPGNQVKLKLIRGGQRVDIVLTSAQLPTAVPSELPPASRQVSHETSEEKLAEPAPPAAAGQTMELQLAEFSQRCQVYVPASHGAGQPQAVLLWLSQAEKANAEEVIRNWRPICDRDGILLLVPTAPKNKRWERTDFEFLRRLIERAITQFTIDRRRVVVYGENDGGTLAWLLALSGRDLFRGVATSSAPLPRQVRVPPNEPSQRLAIFVASPSSKESTARIAESLEKLSRAGYNVTTTAAALSEQLDKHHAELGRWIDTLDRF